MQYYIGAVSDWLMHTGNGVGPKWLCDKCSQKSLHRENGEQLCYWQSETLQVPQQQSVC